MGSYFKHCGLTIICSGAKLDMSIGMESINQMSPIKLWLAISVAMALSTHGNSAGNVAAAKLSYDAQLAAKLGGDENGMRNYVFVILKTGPNDANFKDQARTDLFAGHMANIGRLADLGKLAVAGPFGKNDNNYRGIFILAVSTVSEAQKLVQTDPAVKAGVLVAELTPWYGSASLMATPEIHKQITKAKF